MAVVVVVGSRHRHRRPCAVVLVLLLFLALHHCEALTTSTSASTSASASRRIRVRRGALLSHDSSGEHEPGGDATATVIGKGTSLVVDVMHLGSSLVVHGHLQVKALKLLLQNQLDVVVGESGVLQGDIAGLDTVQVCGMLKGRVHCARLIIDEQGEIIGDVKADLLILRPGGRIQGAIHCGQVGSELKIFEDVKRPLQVSYSAPQQPKRKTSPPSAREKAGVALRALSDPMAVNPVPRNQSQPRTGPRNEYIPLRPRSATVKRPLSNVNPPLTNNSVTPLVDHFGHPLIGAAPEHVVATYRKNKELMHATRTFLDNAKANKDLQQLLGQQDEQDAALAKKRKDEDGLPSFLR